MVGVLADSRRWNLQLWSPVFFGILAIAATGMAQVSNLWPAWSVQIGVFNLMVRFADSDRPAIGRRRVLFGIPSAPPATNEPFYELTVRIDAAVGQDMPFLARLIELQAWLNGRQSGALFVICLDVEPRLITAWAMTMNRWIQVEPQRMRFG